MFTAESTEAAGQLLVSQEVPGQRAFKITPEARATLLPIVAQSEPELTIAVTAASLAHVQVEADAQAKLNRALQEKAVLVPARFVLDPKVISTFDPSLLNAAEVRTGAGSGAYSGRTARLRPLTPV
jgi:ribosomal protein L16/L10AE